MHHFLVKSLFYCPFYCHRPPPFPAPFPMYFVDNQRKNKSSDIILFFAGGEGGGVPVMFPRIFVLGVLRRVYGCDFCARHILFHVFYEHISGLKMKMSKAIHTPDTHTPHMHSNGITPVFVCYIPWYIFIICLKAYFAVSMACRLCRIIIISDKARTATTTKMSREREREKHTAVLSVHIAPGIRQKKSDLFKLYMHGNGKHLACICTVI